MKAMIQGGNLLMVKIKEIYKVFCKIKNSIREIDIAMKELYEATNDNGSYNKWSKKNSI